MRSTKSQILEIKTQGDHVYTRSKTGLNMQNMDMVVQHPNSVKSGSGTPSLSMLNKFNYKKAPHQVSG